MHPPRVPSYDEVLQTFRRAGFPSFTPLQQKLIPLMLKSRDALAEVPDGSGVSTAIVAPLVLGLRGSGAALRALILLPTAEDVGKVSRAFTRFTRAVRDAPAFIALGEIEDARRESRRLEKESTVVAGTVERVIDHIRRGGLSFSELQTVIVREPAGDQRADFIKDVQFIVAKWTERPRMVLLARSPVAEDSELVALLHHPLSMDAQDSRGPSAAAAARAIFVPVAIPPAEALARVVLGMRLPPAIAFHSPKTDARKVADVLRLRGLRAAVLPPPGRQQADRRDMLVGLARRAVDVLLAPLAAGAVSPDLEDAAPAAVVFLDLPTGPIRSPGGMLKRAGVLALGEREKDLGRLQEAIGVAFDKKELPDDDALLTGAIDRVLRRIKDEDKSELSLLRARIRRQVPLLLRPFFMASLLKSQLPQLAPADRQPGRAVPAPRQRPGEPAPGATADIPPRGQRGRFGRSAPDAGRPPRPQEAPRGPRADARSPGPTGSFTQLFISVGRNRRVYARDLTDLFTEKLQLVEGDIGGVRVFDKYSFVDIVPGKAEEAITKLNGLDVKGRPIAVNYAKKKEEKEAK
jgi:ATP-dependent RNA helicase DeaD